MVDRCNESSNEWMRTPIYAILLFQLAALVSRSFIEVHLQDKGLDSNLATNLSYLVVPPLFLILMFPVLWRHGRLIVELIQVKQLNWRLTGVGVLLAFVLWLAGIAINILTSAQEVWVSVTALDTISLQVSWSCTNYLHFLIGITIMALLVPVIEEVVNRGFVLHYFLPRGRFMAVLISALIFAVFHEPNSMPFTFVAGIYFAYITLNSSTLWPAIIAHSAYNLYGQIYTGCIFLGWKEVPAVSDVFGTSILTSFAIAALLAVGALLVTRKRSGAR